MVIDEVVGIYPATVESFRRDDVLGGILVGNTGKIDRVFDIGIDEVGGDRGGADDVDNYTDDEYPKTDFDTTPKSLEDGIKIDSAGNVIENADESNKKKNDER